jgi:gliding motility-associated-like protein
MVLTLQKTHAQLGFCQGNSGDPIFVETFGSGLTDTALPAGTTTYTYANGNSPDDGLYTVTSNTNYFDWFDVDDVTPNDTNGRMLLVNSSFTPGEFYRTDISGLCENTTYEFSSWLINLTPLDGFCGATAIPINVRFEIWDNTDTNLLASGATGDISGTITPNWEQYALVFQTLPGQTSVILKMINNSSGGCGNDLAIDDIVFKSCGDLIIVEDATGNNSESLCSSFTPYSQTINAIPDNAVFSSHFYQWQSSTDGVNWVDIIGETNNVLNIVGLTTTTFYRAKVAEFAANLTNADCITFSDVYEVNITQAPPQPVIECWETATFDDNLCDWVVSGSQPIEPTTECWETATFNTTTCSWEITGIQPPEPVNLECWETANFDDNLCDWVVTGSQPVEPTTQCWETATFNNITCSWEVTGTQPPEPVGLECWETATFNTIVCAWEVTGTEPQQPILECWETATFDLASCSWIVSGVQPPEPSGLECWETAIFNDAICQWEVFGSEPEEPTDLLCWQSTVFDDELCEWQIIGDQPLEFRDEFLFLCEGETIDLEAISVIENPSYQWESGEDSFSITIDSGGTYMVEVTDNCFTEIITFNVTEIELPIIESVSSNGNSIVVNLENPDEYVYSLDGVNFQISNVFSDVEGGLYTVYVKSNVCEVVVTADHIHFYIQKFITPNGDGNNDTFNFNLAPYYSSTEIYIFNRFGKLLYSANNSNVNWDGTFIGNKLPSADYWYKIVIDGQEFYGHFTLKR